MFIVDVVMFGVWLGGVPDPKKFGKVIGDCTFSPAKAKDDMLKA